MSELLLVIPAGWQEITWDQLASTTLDRNSIVATISSGVYGDMAAALKDAGLMPVDKELVAARLIEAMENTVFIIRYV